MKKLSILVLLFCFNFASAQEDSTVYHNAISSIGMITDKTASVASGFFIDKNIFITNWHVTDHFDIPSGKIKMKDGSRFTIKKIVEENIKKDISIVETNENCSSFLFLNDTFQTGGQGLFDRQPDR